MVSAVSENFELRSVFASRNLPLPVQSSRRSSEIYTSTHRLEFSPSSAQAVLARSPFSAFILLPSASGRLAWTAFFMWTYAFATSPRFSRISA